MSAGDSTDGRGGGETLSGFAEMSLQEAAPETERNRQFLAYWRELHAGVGGLPAKRDFDPSRVPGLLAQLMIFERMADGDYTVRLAGTAIEALAGRDMAGRRLGAVLTGEPLARTRIFFDEILDRPCAYLIGNFYQVGHHSVPIEQLQLPFTEPDGRPSFVFVTLVERIHRLPRHVDLSGQIPEVVPGTATRIAF